MLNENGTPWIKPFIEKIWDEDKQRHVNAHSERAADPRFCNYVSAIWNGVRREISRPIKAMDFMRQVFNAYRGIQELLRNQNPDHVDQPLVYVTPTGFPCTFFQPVRLGRDTEGGAADEFNLRISLPNLSNGGNRKVGFSKTDYTRCDWKAIRGQIAPGVVHALDSSLLHRLFGTIWPTCGDHPASVVHDALLVPAPLAAFMQQAGCDAFRSIHEERSFLEDFAKQALGFVPDELVSKDEETNVISRSADAWDPAEASDSCHLFS